MRFYEKLPKLRKDNNFSQEQLAEKLGVSRQAVSKWEMGSSYPDMDKILQMCKILNCNLEDLMDDGVLGESLDKSNKININNYIKDFLNFITRSYNMFCSMKFKEKIQFLLEMFAIFFVLFIMGVIITRSSRDRTNRSARTYCNGMGDYKYNHKHTCFNIYSGWDNNLPASV